MNIEAVDDLRVAEALEACRKRHETLYSEYPGYTSVFHGYVERGMQAFVAAHDPAKDRIWRARRDGDVLGWVAIQHTKGDWAQLRWFLVESAARGQGIGAGLLEEALAFARAAGYQGVFLWTVSDLPAARHLYQQGGFRLVEEHEEPCPWAPWAHEQRWELGFSP